MITPSKGIVTCDYCGRTTALSDSCFGSVLPDHWTRRVKIGDDGYPIKSVDMCNYCAEDFLESARENPDAEFAELAWGWQAEQYKNGVFDFLNTGKKKKARRD